MYGLAYIIAPYVAVHSVHWEELEYARGTKPVPVWFTLNWWLSFLFQTQRRIYWDWIHNSEALFEVVAKEAWGGRTFIEPTNVLSLTQ